MGTASEDPLAALPVGASIPLTPIVVGGSDASQIPDGVINWDFFEGALLAVFLRDPESEREFQVTGTAVMIAPGLAVTATHIVSESLDRLATGRAAALLFGVRSDRADIWKIRSISHSNGDDTAYLSLELASPIDEEWRFTTLPLTTRCPAVGEELTIVGFRMAQVEELPTGGFSPAGDLYAAAGAVANVHYPIRDTIGMPFPTIDLLCGALHAMSGGAVLDRHGFLVGIISRSWTFTEEDEGEPLTHATWIVGALGRELEIPWPPGLYPRPTHLLDVPERALHIEGRNRIGKAEHGIQYEVWFE